MAFLFLRHRSEAMNATRPEPPPRVTPTHTFWPAGRRPEPASAKPTTSGNDKKDDEPVGDEPGYGHGV
jgi:hypothetical protein